jgi:hypothetical protein
MPFTTKHPAQPEYREGGAHKFGNALYFSAPPLAARCVAQSAAVAELPVLHISASACRVSSALGSLPGGDRAVRALEQLRALCGKIGYRRAGSASSVDGTGLTYAQIFAATIKPENNK